MYVVLKIENGVATCLKVYDKAPEAHDLLKLKKLEHLTGQQFKLLAENDGLVFSKYSSISIQHVSETEGDN